MLQLVSIFECNLIKKRRRKIIRSRKLPNKLKYQLFSVNFDGKSGAVGFVSVLFPFVYPARLIRVNESGEVIRDPDTGLCVACKPGQTGEFVGKIVKNNPSRSFDGYVDKSATERKIVRGVINKNDMWFRSGDLMCSDEFGWMHFIDRSGDTYRYEIY